MNEKPIRQHYVMHPKQIKKLVTIKDKTGASASHSVRKAVDQYRPRILKFKDNGK